MSNRHAKSRRVIPLTRPSNRALIRAVSSLSRRERTFLVVVITQRKLQGEDSIFPKCIPMNCIYVDRINSLVVLRDREFVEFNEIVVTFRIVIRVDLMRQALFA